jgi:hypothetical protein
MAKVHEHSPRIPEMANRLKNAWRVQLAQRNGTIPVQPSARFDKIFTEVAVMMLENEIDPERYVSIALDKALATTHVFPTVLKSDATQRAFMEQKNKTNNTMTADTGNVRAAHYVAQFNRADALIRAGKKPDQLATGSYDLGPLVLWLVYESFHLDSKEYYSEAKAELSRNPEAKTVFGDLLKGLGC